MGPGAIGHGCAPSMDLADPGTGGPGLVAGGRNTQVLGWTRSGIDLSRTIHSAVAQDCCSTLSPVSTEARKLKGSYLSYRWALCHTICRWKLTFHESATAIPERAIGRG